MADKCIVIVNKQQQQLMEQNQNVCESNQSNDLCTETAILNVENAHNISASSLILPNDNSSMALSTKLKSNGVCTTVTTATAAATTIEMSATKTTMTTTTIPTGRVENNSDVNNEDDEEDVSEKNHDIPFVNHIEKLCLETPVLDDNNELLGIESMATNSHQIHCKRHSCMLGNDATEILVTKPKRLSDEFSTPDDGEDEDIENEENGNNSSTVIVRPGAALNFASDAVSDVVDSTNTMDLVNDTIDNKSIFGSAAVVDDEISTCSLNLISDNPAPQHLEDSSSPHSSISPDLLSDIRTRDQQCVNVADVVEELTNQGDEHPQHHRIAHDNHMFSNNSNSNLDVQSMDAIERSDFEIEQKATTRRIFGKNSLIKRNGSEVRLNLGLVNNSFSQKMDESDDHEPINQTEGESSCSDNKPKSSSSSAQAGCSSKIFTTPTSRRNKRSRFNLSKSMEKSTDQSERSNDEQKLEYFAHNSNDSLSSDNQYPMDQQPSDSADAEPDDDKPSGSQRTLCSACKLDEDNDNNDDDDDDMNDDDDDDIDDDDDDDNFEEDNFRPSTSKGESSQSNRCDCLFSPRTNTWKTGSCSCAPKNKKDVGTETDSLCNGPSTSNPYRRAQSRATSTGYRGNLDEPAASSDFKMVMNMETDTSFDAWSCDIASDTEEVCTCRDYTDDEMQSSEDELPSRDVDLSYYSISEDVLNGNSTDTPTTRNHRKRKLTETRTPIFSEIDCNINRDVLASERKRLALENISKCGSSPTPTTPTTLNSPSSAFRTPRSVIPTRDNPPPELSDWLNQFQQWSHVERLLAVDHLIEHCEPTQVRHMMKVIEPQFQRDFISLLPREVGLQVLSYLPPKDLLRAAQTCRSWRELCDDDLLWKGKCKQSGICIETSNDRPRRGRVGNMPPISSKWKAAYMRQHIIEMNWRSRPVRDPKILKGHDDHVITCLQFYGNRIVSGSDDNTLKVWSAITGKCLRTLIGHTGGVWSSQMSANIIVSGSTDRTLKVWNAENGNCIHTLTGHTSTVRCMHLHEKTVVSGSRDATLRVWDIVEGKCLHTLVGHLAAVRCVQYDGKLVVSGAYDYMVKVWNPETEECLHTLQGHTNRVYSLQFDGVHVVSGSLDTTIRVWDATTGTCKHTLLGHQSLTSGMELRQNILVSGNADSTVKVWDITTGNCLHSLSGSNKHQSAVTCLQFNSRFVITSSDDGTVKLWDVRTGEFIRNLVALESGGSGGVVWRIRSNDTKLICAVGSRNGTEETKLMVLDFDVEGACLKCS